MIELRSRDEIEAMRPAGWFVAAVLTELAERTQVGINVLELERIAHAMIREHRATSCYIDNHPRTTIAGIPALRLQRIASNLAMSDSLRSCHASSKVARHGSRD